jgi:hypothetical protein
VTTGPNRGGIVRASAASRAASAAVMAPTSASSAIASMRPARSSCVVGFTTVETS